MYGIAICDDEIYFAEQLREYIQEYCQKRRQQVFLKLYTDSEDLMESLSRRRTFDLYILDIIMPGHSGMELLDMVERNHLDAEVILLTADISYAVEACSYKKVFRYIPKEELTQRMGAALDAFFLEMDRKRERNPYIIQNKLKCLKFYQEDVAYVYKDKKYAVFTFADGRKEKERRSLSEVCERMHGSGMVMLDRSYIVNLLHIRRINLDEVHMDTGDILRTNRCNILRLKEAFSAWWGELM